MTMSKKGGRAWKAAGLATALGADLTVCILLGFYGGKWLGEKLGSVPMCIVAGVLIGIVVGVTNVIVVIKKVLEDSDG